LIGSDLKKLILIVLTDSGLLLFCKSFCKSKFQILSEENRLFVCLSEWF